MKEAVPPPDLRIHFDSGKCVDVLVVPDMNVPFKQFFRKVLKFLKIDKENIKEY